jgi:protease II
MLARIKQTDLSVPYRKGGFVYYARTVEGRQYPYHCRRPGETAFDYAWVLGTMGLSAAKPLP